MPDPWLRRLYVVWAAPSSVCDPSETSIEFGPEVNFTVAQTDEKGYICPLRNTLDPAPEATLPLFPGLDYYFFFVRHPDSSLAEQLCLDMNADPYATVARVGQPQFLQAILTETGKDKAKKPIEEGVISIATDPKKFVQLGSPRYGGWALFRNMPGTGSNQKDTDIQCKVLFDQVRRLQYHLGALRYIIGNQWHPYSPEPFLPTKDRNKLRPKLPELLYPNEGVFEHVTWNAVLRFQRDARAGLCVELDRRVARTPTIDSVTFDPLPAAANWQLEMDESTHYLSDLGTSGGAAAPFPIPGDVDTLVESTTAEAIHEWLKLGLRNPGKILVSRGTYDSWMQEDVYDTINRLDDEVRRLGVSYPLAFNNAFRDVRMSVVDPGPGQIVTSIHKSGFAFDMTMIEFVEPNRAAPYHYVRNPGAGRAVWTVYAEATAANIPAGLPPYATYEDTIIPWEYDASSPEGGAPGAPLAKPGIKFLNFTAVCDHFQIKDIGAHKSGWQGSAFQKFTLNSGPEFQEFLAHLGRQFPIPDKKKAVYTMDVNGKRHLVFDCVALYTFLTHWQTAGKAFHPTPQFTFDPSTAEGEQVVRSLRGDSFKGAEVSLSVAGFWAGGKGASGFPKADADPKPDTSSGKLTLGPEVEFPPKFACTISPITGPAQISQGTEIEFITLGHPAHMEWWHFQYEPGFTGQNWGGILDLIGWTPEGLLGKDGGLPIFGLYGLGYTTKHLSTTVS
jgi:hypothetical protein